MNKTLHKTSQRNKCLNLVNHSFCNHFIKSTSYSSQNLLLQTSFNLAGLLSNTRNTLSIMSQSMIIIKILLYIARYIVWKSTAQMPYPLGDSVGRHIEFYPVTAKRFLEGNDACPQATTVVGDAGIFKDDALVTQAFLPH